MKIQGFTEHKELGQYLIDARGNYIKSNESQIMNIWHFWSVSYKPTRKKRNGWNSYYFNKIIDTKDFEGEIKRL